MAWLVQRPGGNTFLQSQGPHTLLSFTPDSPATHIRTFPSLPFLPNSFSNFNACGSLLALASSSSASSVLLLRFPDTLSSATRLDDCLDEAQLAGTVADDRLALRWVSGPCMGGFTQGIKWGMDGRFHDEEFVGTFHGAFQGTFCVYAEGESVQTGEFVTKEWMGKCEIHAPGMSDREWPFRICTRENVRTRAVAAAVGRVTVEAVDPLAYMVDEPVQVAWHPCSNHHLCVLDATGTVRVYNTLVNLLVPETKVKFAFGEDFSNTATSRRAVSMRFLDNERSFWSRLCCFVMFTDGCVVAACPLGDPRTLTFAREDLDAMANSTLSAIDACNVHDKKRSLHERLVFVRLAQQTQKFDANLRIGFPAIQCILPPSKTPAQRYVRGGNPVRGGNNSSSSTAFDFWIARCDTKSPDGEIMVHRSWTCGHLDVTIREPEEIIPWWAQSTYSLFTPAGEGDEYVGSQPAGPFSKLKGKILNTLGYGACITFGPPHDEALSKVVRCMAVFHTGLPYIYPINSLPFSFVCVDGKSGAAVLLNADFAMDLNSISHRGVSISARRFAEVAPFDSKSSCSLYDEPLLGIGFLAKANKSTRTELINFDLFKELRLMMRPATPAPPLGTDASEALLLFETEDKALANEIKAIRGNLEAFYKSVPEEMSRIVLDQRGTGKDFDDRLGLATAEFLPLYWEGLFGNQGNNASGVRSVVDVLNAEHLNLAARTRAQIARCGELVEELQQSQHLFEAMEKERLVMKEHIETFHELLTNLHETGSLVLARWKATRHVVPTFAERAFVDKLKALEGEIGNLKHVLAEREKKIQSGKIKLQEVSENLNAELLLTEMAREDLVQEFLCVFDHLEKVRKIVKRREINDVEKYPCVFLVGTRDNDETDDLSSKFHRRFEAQSAPRVFIQDHLLNHTTQSMLRKCTKSFKDKIPLEVPSRSLHCVVHVILLSNVSIQCTTNNDDVRVHIYRKERQDADGYDKMVEIRLVVDRRLVNSEGRRLLGYELENDLDDKTYGEWECHKMVATLTSCNNEDEFIDAF